jgi:hypothetical protein
MGCEAAHYCNETCQAADWHAEHREWCHHVTYSRRTLASISELLQCLIGDAMGDDLVRRNKALSAKQTAKHGAADVPSADRWLKTILVPLANPSARELDQIILDSSQLRKSLLNIDLTNESIVRALSREGIRKMLVKANKDASPLNILKVFTYNLSYIFDAIVLILRDPTRQKEYLTGKTTSVLRVNIRDIELVAQTTHLGLSFEVARNEEKHLLSSETTLGQLKQLKGSRKEKIVNIIKPQAPAK